MSTGGDDQFRRICLIGITGDGKTATLANLYQYLNRYARDEVVVEEVSPALLKQCSRLMRDHEDFARTVETPWSDNTEARKAIVEYLRLRTRDGTPIMLEAWAGEDLYVQIGQERGLDSTQLIQRINDYGVSQLIIVANPFLLDVRLGAWSLLGLTACVLREFKNLTLQGAINLAWWILFGTHFEGPHELEIGLEHLTEERWDQVKIVFEPQDRAPGGRIMFEGIDQNEVNQLFQNVQECVQRLIDCRFEQSVIGHILQVHPNAIVCLTRCDLLDRVLGIDSAKIREVGENLFPNPTFKYYQLLLVGNLELRPNQQGNELLYPAGFSLNAQPLWKGIRALLPEIPPVPMKKIMGGGSKPEQKEQKKSGGMMYRGRRVN